MALFGASLPARRDDAPGYGRAVSDYFEELEMARSRLRIMSEELRRLERREVEPIGPSEAGLYADWCDAIGQVLSEL